MISEKSKQVFLNRRLYNYDFLKTLSEDEIDNVLSDLDPEPEFSTEPMLHQKVGFILGIERPDFLFFNDTGTGKSKLILDILNYRIKYLGLGKTLVLVPNLANVEGWISEIKKHSPDLTAVSLLGIKQERLEALRQDANLYIINYAGLVSLCTNLSKFNKNKKGKRVIDRFKLSRFKNMFDGIIADECVALKNIHSLTYKIVNELAQNCSIRYGLTGTPFGRSPEDLWAQFHAIDRGKTLGYTLGMFRECFFKKKKNYWGGFEYTLLKKMEPKLHRFLKNSSIRYKLEDCVDLPPSIYSIIEVSMPEEILPYYEGVVEQIRQADKQYDLMQNAFIRMRQLTSGFMGAKDALENKVEIEFLENPKLDATLELINEIPEERKIIVFHEFIRTGKSLSAALEKKKIKHGTIWGSTKDPGSVVKKFSSDPRLRVLIVNSKAGGSGLNLQAANYVLYLESSVSPIVRTQTEARCRRKGQEADHIFYYDIVMKGSIDNKILKYLKEGEDLFKKLVEGKEIV